jgi:hypothetical protein
MVFMKNTVLISLKIVVFARDTEVIAKTKLLSAA